VRAPGSREPQPTWTQSRHAGQRAPGDAAIFKRKFNTVAPGGYESNVMESSVGLAGKFAFFTGNWYAARSINGGYGWSYISSFSGYPEFCCDQVSIYDESRDIFAWLRMGSADANGENTFKLSISKNAFGGGYWTYTFAPTDVNGAWTNEWWDYPHIQLGADYMYISWNMFNQAGSWTRTVMLRFPLDALAAAAGFSYNYYAQSDWFTFVPVSGAEHTMYFASNWPSTVPMNSRLGIWRWDEDATGLSYWTRDVTAWTGTGRGDMHCAGYGGTNWLARGDQRLLTGARYTISSDGIAEDRIRGRKIVAWWWNVAEGGSFTYPYVDAAAFYESDMTQVAGYLGRPFVWSGSWCFAYPSVAPNKRQDLGMVVNYSSGYYMRPQLAFSLADDYMTAPPGWMITNIMKSKGSPSDQKWGDYNTVRAWMPSQDIWVGGGHWIPTRGTCSNCAEPIFVVFGRERDIESWYRFRTK
jgi:hypothetical protein